MTALRRSTRIPIPTQRFTIEVAEPKPRQKSHKSHKSPQPDFTRGTRGTRGTNPRHTLLPLAERAVIARELFEDNKYSDEYFTSRHAWDGFMGTKIHDLIQDIQFVLEPFAGDGSVAKEWKQIRTLHGNGIHCELMKGDFWDNAIAGVDIPDCYDYIATNPPFSSKWLVLETLLEWAKPKKLKLAVILPWGCFYGSGKDRLDWFQGHFGGKWARHDIPDKGQHFWHPPEKCYKKVGTYILEWTW
jgi:hypothetical protein